MDASPVAGEGSNKDTKGRPSFGVQSRGSTHKAQCSLRAEDVTVGVAVETGQHYD